MKENEVLNPLHIIIKTLHVYPSTGKIVPIHPYYSMNPNTNKCNNPFEVGYEDNSNY